MKPSFKNSKYTVIKITKFFVVFVKIGDLFGILKVV